MVTLQDVADQAGVSKSTASRALNEDLTLSITETTKERIINAANELGYFPKRSRNQTESRRIAIIHKESHYQNQIDNALYFSIRFGIESMCHNHHINFLYVLNTAVKTIPSNVDGVIINGNYGKEQFEEILGALRGVPSVVVGRPNYCPPGSDWVTVDVHETVRMGMDHLVERGHRSFLYVGGRAYEGTPACYRNISQYHDYIAADPRLHSVGELEGNFDAESGYEMISRWLDSGKTLPDAIYVSHDPVAVGVIRALSERGFSIPNDVAVIGSNGDSICNLTVPTLSTIDVHAENMGQEAVAMLLDRLSNTKLPPRKITFTPELTVRQST